MELRAMTAEEFEPYAARLAEAYGAEVAATGRWHPDEAAGRARAELREQLPQGVDTPDHVFLIALDDEGDLGVLWIGLSNPRGIPDLAWINDIEVYEARQGAGLGRALLGEAERVAREHGVPWLGLNVFGGNTRARRLYESAGYETTNVLMRKRLLP